MCGVPIPIRYVRCPPLPVYLFSVRCPPPFATLGSVLDSKQSWESGKFQLVRWSHRLFFYVVLQLNYQLISTCISECGNSSWACYSYFVLWKQTLSLKHSKLPKNLFKTFLKVEKSNGLVSDISSTVLMYIGVKYLIPIVSVLGDSWGAVWRICWDILQFPMFW